MQRYFTAQEVKVDDFIEMSQDDTHHMKNVMRMAKDDTVELVDSKSQLFVAKIETIGERVHLRVLEARDDKSELPVETTLFIPLLKGDKLDWLLQKATELGAVHINLYEAERAVVKLDPKKKEKKLQRFEKIVKEAAEQSKRLKVPSLQFVGNAKSLTIGDYDRFFIAYEGLSGDASKQLNRILTDDLKRVACIFGPEGGFSDAEVESLHDANAVRLGPRILRAETAPLYFLSALSIKYE